MLRGRFCPRVCLKLSSRLLLSAWLQTIQCRPPPIACRFDSATAMCSKLSILTRFRLVLTEYDLYLSGEGTHYLKYEKLGAHVREVAGVRGVHFAVWAPNAQRVSVVGNFNFWDGRVHPMRHRGASGIWEIFIPGLEEGELYKFEILSTLGKLSRAESRSVRIRSRNAAEKRVGGPQH